MHSLVIGRFQPLHKGHVQMLEYAASKSTFLVIGVGSCNRQDTFENPFLAQEREQMIKESLEFEIPYELRRIPDFDDDQKWIGWISENIHFDTLMSNSELEQNIFRGGGFNVLDIPFYDRQKLSSTEVRKKMIEGGDWMSLLPAGTLKIIEEIDGVERVKKLSR